jgi:hypothetical protein
MQKRPRVRPATFIMGTAAVVTVVVLGASSAVASPARAARGHLSGTWSGTYGGAFHGTFTLHWQQTKSRLAGTIKLSSSRGTTTVTGTVRGSTIRFGTVGSRAITYSGSVSGSSMSGHYSTPGGGGAWSAHKTS